MADLALSGAAMQRAGAVWEKLKEEEEIKRKWAVCVCVCVSETERESMCACLTSPSLFQKSKSHRARHTQHDPKQKPFSKIYFM